MHVIFIFCGLDPVQYFINEAPVEQMVVNAYNL